MSRAEEIVAEFGDSIVAPSAVVAKLLHLLADPNHGRNDLERVLRTDAAFAGEILVRANSSWRSRRSVPDLATALSLLGETELSRIAMRASARCMQVPDVPGYGMVNGGLWLQSLRSAVAAEILAAHTGLAPPGVAYTAGLLLDVGKRLLGQDLAEELEDAIEASESDEQCFTQVERSLLGCDHAEVGAALIKSWSLPDELATAVRWHHNPSETESALAWLCHVGDFLAISLSGAGSVEGSAYQLNEQWRQILNVDEEELLGILPVIDERANEALGDLEEAA
jgi:HD-like signal output (HDOD) protein